MSNNKLEVDWASLGERRRGPPNSPTPTPPPSSPAPRPTAMPYPVERFTFRDFKPVVYSSQQMSQQKYFRESGLPLSSLTSGTIITMWADLVEFGFPGHKADRWFVVLGKLLDEPDPKPVVVFPLTTLNRRGKTAPTLPEWAAQFYKEVKSDTCTDSYDTSTCSTRISTDLSPNQAVYTRKHHCAPGEILTLATAFIVRADDQGNIPAKYDGYLTRQSIDDVWNSFAHLMTDHQEIGYLLETNMPDWNQSDALEAMGIPDEEGFFTWCTKDDCLYGKILKTARDKSDVLAILKTIFDVPDTAAVDRALWNLLGKYNDPYDFFNGCPCHQE